MAFNRPPIHLSSNLLWRSAAVAVALCLRTVAAPLPSASQVVPGTGSDPARDTTVAGKPALLLQARFSRGNMDRCFWDIPVNWDLSSAAGIALQWQCPDASSVSQFNVYVRAQGVWHAANLSSGRPGQWQSSQVLKPQLAPEGTSKGWRRVDQVRLAAWRGGTKDTTLVLADLIPLGPSVPAAILCGNSTVPSAERGAARRYARNVADAFANYGMRLACIDDVDLAAVGLAAQKLVIVPYHPEQPAPMAEQLRTFVERGGKVMGFYNLPESLGQTLGMATGPYVRSSQIAEGVAGIVFKPDIVAGLPKAMRQDSGNFLEMAPTGHGAVRVGWWSGHTGQATRHCAAVVSSRGAWFGHVYLGQDATNGPMVLLSLAGHLLPEIWRQAAAGGLARVTSGVSNGPYKATLESLRQLGRDHPQALEAFTRSEQCYSAAERLLGTGQCAAALSFTDRCRRELTTGILLMQRAPSGEFRAVWCHRGYGIDGWSWDRSATQLAACGFNALLVNIATAGKADYPSAILEPSPTLTRQGDQLRLCLDACRRRGIQVHAWKLCFNLGNDSAARQRLAAAGRLQRTATGQTRDWLCPSHPENRKQEADVAREMLVKYPDLAGVHLDFIRFPGSDTCFCDTCRRGFEAAIGKRVSPWPGAVRGSDALSERWQAYRRAVITDTVKQVALAAHRVKPDARISVAVFSNWLTARDTVAQDWVAWAKGNDVDFVCPMDYHADAAALRTDVTRQMALAKGTGVRVFPGIGVSTGKLDALETMRQINVTRTAGTGGFVLFEYNAREALDVLPELAPAMGQTRASP